MNEVFTSLALAAIVLIVVPQSRMLVPVAVSDALASHAAPLRWVEAFVITELSGYWGHRLSHEIPALWRFHRVHHSARDLDWLAPSRRHPVDAIVARSSTALPVLMLGFSIPTVVTVFALRRLQGLLVHANINLRLGPLEEVFGELDRHRHSIEARVRRDADERAFELADVVGDVGGDELDRARSRHAVLSSLASHS